MIRSSIPLRGIVRGKIIEFETEIGLPDGQDVIVLVEVDNDPLSCPSTETDAQRLWSAAQSQLSNLRPGEGLKRSFGAWADETAELDDFLAENRQRRSVGDMNI